MDNEKAGVRQLKSREGSTSGDKRFIVKFKSDVSAGYAPQSSRIQAIELQKCLSRDVKSGFFGRSLGISIVEVSEVDVNTTLEAFLNCSGNVEEASWALAGP